MENHTPAPSPTPSSPLSQNSPRLFRLKKSKIILIFLGILPLISVLLIFSLGKIKPDLPLVCREESKICPDGSEVGRSKLKCEFYKCPEFNINNTIDKKIWNIVESETKDFYIYKNLKHGYQFEAPKNWTFFEEGRSYAYYSYKFVILSPDFSTYHEGLVDLDGHANGTKIGLTILSTGYQSTNDWFNSSENYFSSNTKDYESSVNLNVADVKAYEFKSKSVQGKTIYTEFIKDRNKYTISYDQYNDRRDDDLAIYNQILSSFKFIKPTELDISTWKTYNNTDFKYSFKYPPDWHIYLMKDYPYEDDLEKTDKNEIIISSLAKFPEFGYGGLPTDKSYVGVNVTRKEDNFKGRFGITKIADYKSFTQDRFGYGQDLSWLIPDSDGTGGILIYLPGDWKSEKEIIDVILSSYKLTQ